MRNRSRWTWLAVVVVFALVAAACGGDDDEATDTTAAPGTTAAEPAGPTGDVSVFGAPTGIEAAGMSDLIESEINANAAYTATYEGSDSFEEQVKIRVEGGNPPDVALYPQPGAVLEQAAAGNAIALEDMGYDRADLEATFGKYLLSLGEYEGKYYGLPTNVNMKSFVWYPEPAFTDAGYTAPATWDELIDLSDQMVADGNTPWCIGIGSDANTGWPATDWMEDIMLRTAGSEAYDLWVTNDLKFSSPEVKRAATLLGDIAFNEDYVLGGGGGANIPDIDFRDAPDPMFQDPPACFLHRQASFITTFFDAADGRALEANVDYGVFAFPDIDPGVKGALGAGELAAVFEDRPEVRAFLDAFTSQDWQCKQAGLEGVGRISPRLDVGTDCYANPILATAAGTIVAALANEGFRFDASDLMPTAVGSGSFWTGMNDYMRGGPDVLDQVLADIDESWPTE